MLPRMSSTVGFQGPKRQSNADKLYPLAASSWFCSCRTTAQLRYVSRAAGKMLLGIKGTPHFGTRPESARSITATSPTSAWPEVSGIWYQIFTTYSPGFLGEEWSEG